MRADPGARARGDPRPRRGPAHGAAGRGRTDDLRGGGEADEGGQGRGLPCGLDVYDGRGRGAQARRRRRPDGRLSVRPGQARAHPARPDRHRRRDLPLQLPAQPRRPQDRTRPRRRLPGRPQARGADAPRRCSSPSSSPRRAFRRAGSTSSGGPASEIGDVLVEDDRVKLITFTGSVPIGWKLRAGGPEARQPRARTRPR